MCRCIEYVVIAVDVAVRKRAVNRCVFLSELNTTEI